MMDVDHEAATIAVAANAACNGVQDPDDTVPDYSKGCLTDLGGFQRQPYGGTVAARRPRQMRLLETRRSTDRPCSPVPSLLYCTYSRAGPDDDMAKRVASAQAALPCRLPPMARIGRRADLVRDHESDPCGGHVLTTCVRRVGATTLRPVDG
nr:hypothetical protein CFP56_09285 [Quercus suber]